MPNAYLINILHVGNRNNIKVVQAMSGVDLKPKLFTKLCRLAYLIKLNYPIFVFFYQPVFACMDLYHISAYFKSHVYHIRMRFYKNTNLNAVFLQLIDCV